MFLCKFYFLSYQESIITVTTILGRSAWQSARTSVALCKAGLNGAVSSQRPRSALFASFSLTV
jgi:hypothetical protein